MNKYALSLLVSGLFCGQAYAAVSTSPGNDTASHTVYMQSTPSVFSDIKKDAEAAGFKVSSSAQGGVFAKYDSWNGVSDIVPKQTSVGRQNVTYTDIKPYNYVTNKDKHPGHHDSTKGMTKGTQLTFMYRPEGIYMAGHFIGGTVANGANGDHFIANQNYITVDVALPARKVSQSQKSAFVFHGIDKNGVTQLVSVTCD